MRNDEEISCPECGHEFAPIERVWHVCHQCLSIIGPDDDLSKHKSEGNCIYRLGSYRIRYTEEQAEEYQQELITERRL